MEKNNPLYKNQGIHVISCIFTVDKGVTKILLVERKNEPYKGMWALVGGALYNNEKLGEGMRREIKEKTGLENVTLKKFDLFSEVNRSPVMRMIAVGYMGIIDLRSVNLAHETLKTSNASWFEIEEIPNLAYDHNEILKRGLEFLKDSITKSDILKSLYPNGFTIPEIQKVYEAILNKEFDRRNFRKKLLSLGLIEDTGIEATFEGKRPAKLYKFKDKIEEKNIL